MMAVRTRRKWVVPLFVLVVLVLILTVLASGVAAGETATTLSTTAQDLPVPGASQTSEPAGGTLSAFTLKASDLGAYASDPPSVKSPAAIVINAASGKVLYERKADKRRPMASTTKIMTAILVLENLPLTTTVTVSQKAGQTYEPKALLRPGDELTVEQLMYALLIRCSNGAAVALAEAIDGDVDTFVERMNAKAESLDMADTHFANPNGLDAEGHYSTAADMAKVARYAMRDERFRDFVDTATYSLEIPGRSKPIELENTNKLLAQADWVTGVKTGLTPNAEQCLVASATRDGVSVISVLLGQPSSEVCWSESKALLDYGLRQFRHITFMREGTAVAESQVPYHVDGDLRLVTAANVEMDLYKDDEVTAEVRLDRALTLPVTAGEQFGEVALRVGGETVGTVGLVADSSFDEPTLGSKLVYFWHRITGGAED